MTMIIFELKSSRQVQVSADFHKTSQVNMGDFSELPAHVLNLCSRMSGAMIIVSFLMEG